jgi:hypothetical protein
MKHLFKILSLFLIALSCKAQNPILDISERDGWNDTSQVYYKDIHNQLNPFEGTYVYSDGNTSLKIVLQKKTMSFNSVYYEDMLIGEYQYIENGIEKINTLNKLNINYTNKSNHSIDGGIIMTQGNGCNDCLPDEKAVYVGLAENETQNTAGIIIRKTIINDIQAIKIFVMWNMRYKKETDPMPPKASFPGGEYILTRRLER